MEKIDITTELERFDLHLKNNQRTILSARFGDGKSYFLNEYFACHQIWKDYTPIEERSGSVEDTYFVVLHPVNYSVAQNEDVFEYIKRDILVQLYTEGKIDDIDYDAVFGAIGETLKEKALPMFGELVTLLPGGNIAKHFLEFGAELKKRYDDEKKIAVDFISSFSRQKGGIYENDAYTKMICATLAHLKEPQEGLSARKVLVIEDLDRLDPGHIFRILNVLGAHIDENKGTNKFGFDNVVLVMDYDVTKHIFHHLYGESANYEGYMEKFISQNVFHYSIQNIAQQQLVQKMMDLAGEDVLKVLVEGTYRSVGSVTVQDRINKLSVRKVEHILDNLDAMILAPYVESNGLKLSTKNPLTYLLALLTLLDETYKRPSIMEALVCDNWMNWIGALAYADERITDSPIAMAQGRYDVYPVREGDIINGIKLKPSAARREDGVGAEGYKEVIYEAFELALRVVRDAQGLKLVV